MSADVIGLEVPGLRASKRVKALRAHALLLLDSGFRPLYRSLKGDARADVFEVYRSFFRWYQRLRLAAAPVSPKWALELQAYAADYARLRKATAGQRDLPAAEDLVPPPQGGADADGWLDQLAERMPLAAVAGVSVATIGLVAVGAFVLWRLGAFRFGQGGSCG